MSSNAFARSRPRVRHQRVPRTHSCDHPRFLQLVNELARLNELKKKQEELEGGWSGSTSTGDCAVEASNNEDGVISICNNISGGISSAGGGGGIGGGGGTNTNINSGLGSGSICSASNITGASCCNVSPICEAQTSNGYRSLDNNQSSTSALHDNYHQHQQQNHQIHVPHQHHNLHHHNNNTNNNNNHHHHHHHHHQHNHPHHHSGSHLDSQQQHLSNNFQQHHSDRCPGKSSSTTNFAYSKQNLVAEHNNNPSDFSSNNNNNSDLNRQDENRSKRKRSTNDSLTNSRQKNSSSCGSGTSKRLKSSPDAIRPLSPSFTKCPICLLDCMDRDPSFTNTCFHLFCYVCIENWTKNKATCPLCRTKFTKIIYNIKSSTNYEEKIASPIRREEDEYISDRLMLEHLSGLNANSTVSSRNANSDDVQFLFENIRNPEALIPRYFINQMDPRQESIHSFNTVTGFDHSNVPQPPFNSYPITSNYLIFHQANRIPSSTIPSTAISGAYTTNTSLTSSNNDPNTSRRSSRNSRSTSYYPSRIYEPQSVDTPFRNSRVSNTSSSSNSSQPSGVPLERGHHHHHHQHQHQHQQHHQQQTTHRSALDLNQIQTRQSQRFEQSHIGGGWFPSYASTTRNFAPSTYRARHNTIQYNSQPGEHQYILDNFPRPSPDM